jgi:DNA-binding protein
MEVIKISNKNIDRYLSACFYALGDDFNEIQITGRGNNVKRSIDVAAILLRKYLEVPEKIPNYTQILEALDKDDTKLAKELLTQRMCYEIIIGSEKFDERHVSTIDIILRGKRKK